MKASNRWSRGKKPLIEEQQEWLRDFLGYYCEYQLIEKYNPEEYHRFPTTGYLCYDGRRTNTVRRYLESLNIVKKDWGGESLNPVDEEILKILPGFSKEPVFDTKGTQKKKVTYSWEHEKDTAVSNVYDKYIDISDFTPEEMIYLFLHEKDYSFKTLKRVRYNNHTIELLCIYPKVFLETADQNIIRARALEYAQKHLDKVIAHAYGIRLRVVQEGHHNLNFSESEKLISPTGIAETLEKVERDMRLLHRARLELLVLGRIAKREGVDQYTEVITDFSVEYLTEQAPLWMNSEEKEENELMRIMLRKSTVEELELV